MKIFVSNSIVIPAKAGICVSLLQETEMPACTGMTVILEVGYVQLHP